MDSVALNFSFFFYISLNEHMNTFCLVIYKDVELLGQRLCIYSTLINTTKIFSKTVVTMYTSINSVWEF